MDKPHYDNMVYGCLMASIKRLADLYNTPKVGHGYGRGSIKVGVEAAKELFFNPTPLISALDEAEAKFMSRFGAYVRKDANRSMRKSRTGRPSAPGRPPNAHKGGLKTFNYFYYDQKAHDVVIGPIRLPRTRYAVPGLHEFGGTVRPKGSYKLANYRARPFMRPALDKNLARVDELRDSIRK